MKSYYETEIVNLSYEELIGLSSPPGFGSAFVLNSIVAVSS